MKNTTKFKYCFYLLQEFLAYIILALPYLLSEIYYRREKK